MRYHNPWAVSAGRIIRRADNSTRRALDLGKAQIELRWNMAVEVVVIYYIYI